jgi:hypothetical protein
MGKQEDEFATVMAYVRLQKVLAKKARKKGDAKEARHREALAEDALREFRKGSSN